jgi:hypothetical protein
MRRLPARTWLLADDEEEKTHFITVDLDVYSKRRLKALADGFGDKVMVLYEGPWEGRYSAFFGSYAAVRTPSRPAGPTCDEVIQAWIVLIKRLPPAARRFWQSAQSRVFNIGIQSGLDPHALKIQVSARVIRQIEKLRASILITTYPPESAVSKRPRGRKRMSRKAR